MTWLIGITGGIGSGKTTVCKIFESLNIPVYYADVRARFLMNHDSELKSRIREILGKDAYHRNGRLNRAFVAQTIFNNKSLLQAINGVVHPAVHQDSVTWFQGLKDVPYALYEAALLVENGSYKSFNKLIVVAAPEELRIERVMKRDKVKKKQVADRIKNQLSESDKIAVADYIINNDETESIDILVKELHHQILSNIHDNISNPH